MNTSARDRHTPSQADEQSQAGNGHDERGRFVPGNPGGPGNPYARRVAELRRVMLECVTSQEMEIIVGELLVQAKCGKLGAIKLLFQYVLGKPPTTVNPDTLDLEELDLYRRAPTPKEAAEVFTDRLPPGPVAEALRSHLPNVGDRLQEEIGQELSADLEPRQPNDEEECAAEAPTQANGGAREATEPHARPAPSANGEIGAPNRPCPQPASNGTRPASASRADTRRDSGSGASSRRA